MAVSVKFVEDNSIDFVFLEKTMCMSIPLKQKDAESFYESIENRLKGEPVDVYFKRYEEDRISNIKGRLVKLDKSGDYLIIQNGHEEKYFVHFARISEAVVAIIDGNGKMVYGNRSAYDVGPLSLVSKEDIESIKNDGKFNSSYSVPAVVSSKEGTVDLKDNFKKMVS